MLYLLYFCVILQSSVALSSGSLKKVVKSGRIVSGSGSIENQHPYQVALFLHFPEEVGFCGGSLISEKFILTAAHCCFNDDDDEAEVDYHTAVMGAHNIYNEAELGVVRMVATTRHIHPNWNRETFHNDVALVELPSEVDFTDKIQPIAIPPIDYSFVGFYSTVTGWGMPSEGVHIVSPQLREAGIVISQFSRCNSFYANLLISSQICADGNGRATCQGDNGGPLVVAFRGFLYQVGIASFTSVHGCNDVLPSVFTRVASFGGWIQETANLDLDLDLFEQLMLTEQWQA